MDQSHLAPFIKHMLVSTKCRAICRLSLVCKQWLKTTTEMWPVVLRAQLYARYYDEKTGFNKVNDAESFVQYLFPPPVNPIGGRINHSHLMAIYLPGHEQRELWTCIGLDDFAVIAWIVSTGDPSIWQLSAISVCKRAHALVHIRVMEAVFPELCGRMQA